jgi:hypothetical protein
VDLLDDVLGVPFQLGVHGQDSSYVVSSGGFALALHWPKNSADGHIPTGHTSYQMYLNDRKYGPTIHRVKENGYNGGHHKVEALGGKAAVITGHLTKVSLEEPDQNR